MSHFLTVEQVARGYKVQPKDVVEWIHAGKIAAERQSDGTFLIPLAEYQKFGSEMSGDLMQKALENMWNSMERERPHIQEEVRAQFLKNSQVVLGRIEETIKLLEEIHKKYEPGIDIAKDQGGAVAAFIVFARVISLLYSILALLRSGIPAESMILFRPLWEAVLLVEYFSVSDALGHNSNAIRRWFEKEGEIIGAKDVREYVSKHLGLPIELLKKLNNGYSRPVHHTHNSIMESYRGYSLSGMGANFQRRLGFDYHTSSIGRDLVAIISAFEDLIMSVLNAFVQAFWSGLPLTAGERGKIQSEREFYSLDTLERLDRTFGKKKESP